MGGNSSYVSASPAEKQQAQLSQTMWNDYKARYLPVEKQYAKQVTKTDYRRGIEVGRAGAGAMQTASALAARGRKAAYGVGVNPNSGVGASIDSGAPVSAAVGGAESNQNMATTGKAVGHMSDATMVGQGVRGAALQGYNTNAGMGNSEAISQANYKNAGDRAVMKAVGTAVGTYAGLGGNFGFGAKKGGVAAPTPDNSSSYGFNPNEFGNNKVSYDGNNPYVYGRT